MLREEYKVLERVRRLELRDVDARPDDCDADDLARHLGDERGQLARAQLSEETLALFESEDVDLALLLELDSESLDEIEFKAGERDRLAAWLKAVVAFRKRCGELGAKIN